jgi:hypothetical protein
MTSLSAVELKIAPSASSCRLSSPPLTRLPLCATAIGPFDVNATIGCALQSIDPPAVEYRTCPMAVSPGNRASRAGVKTSATYPISFSETILLSSVTEAIPADSCPRCWSA